MKHLVIIGNGIAGVTVARNVRKLSDMKITMVSSESLYHFSRPALMYIFMGHMKLENTRPYEDWFWKKNRIDLLHDHVTSINTETKTITTKNGNSISYDSLVIAIGSKTNKFGWPGQDLPGVQGLYSLQDIEELERNVQGAKQAIIVGGGLIGIEFAEMLHSRGIKVTFLIRENYYWDNILPKEDAMLISRHILEHGFNLIFGTELKEIIAGPDGRTRAVLTSKGEEIECQIVGLTPGVTPNIDFLKGGSIATGRGILVNDFLETNIPDVYAVGDCIEIKSTQEGARNRFEQLWYTGKMHGAVLAKTICGDRTQYERGIWFNSAKFLDIEYQTYGFVSNTSRPNEETFYWEHSSKKISLRLVYSSNDRSLIGINVFGIRLRHIVFEKWIRDKQTVEYALEHLRDAYFDPEFFKQYGGDIIRHYNSLNPLEPIQLQNKYVSVHTAVEMESK